jgi:hypothetical protein
MEGKKNYLLQINTTMMKMKMSLILSWQKLTNKPRKKLKIAK